MRLVLGGGLVALGIGLVALAVQNHLGEAWAVISGDAGKVKAAAQ